MYSKNSMHNLKNANSYKKPIIKILIALLVAAIIVVAVILLTSSVEYIGFKWMAWLIACLLLSFVVAYISIQNIEIEAVYSHRRGKNGKIYTVIDVINMIDRRTSIHVVLEANDEVIIAGCGRYNYRNPQNIADERYSQKEYHYFIDDKKFFDYYGFKEALEKRVGANEVLVLLINDRWQ